MRHLVAVLSLAIPLAASAGDAKPPLAPPPAASAAPAPTHAGTVPGLPAVNEQNCRPEAIKAMPDTPARRKFAGLCLRRVKLTPGADTGLHI